MRKPGDDSSHEWRSSLVNENPGACPTPGQTWDPGQYALTCGLICHVLGMLHAFTMNGHPQDAAFKGWTKLYASCTTAPYHTTPCTVSPESIQGVRTPRLVNAPCGPGTSASPSMISRSFRRGSYGWVYRSSSFRGLPDLNNKRCRIQSSHELRVDPSKLLEICVETICFAH